MNETIIIRKALKKDIKKILTLNFGNSFVTSESEDIFWPEEILEKCINNNDTLIYIAETQDKLIGFVICGIVKSMEKMHCENIFVKDEFRKQNVGKKLMDAILCEAKNQNLRYIVALTNKANKFLLKMGFEEGHTFTWYDLNLKRQKEN